MTQRTTCVLACVFSQLLACGASAAEPVARVVAPQVPAGFSIELVAGPPLVDRPIVASFDDEGRLYVADSSGSNAPVEEQLAERPHRIVRLEDADGDGRFDRRTVFADRMMFPEGALFLDGSLYVSAPPSIWKLTDRDGDGMAEERVEWFAGETLTGCANDLHGPYLGLDGWLYWCKGAFAEQTHTVAGRPWTTRAAHIFRRHPDGGELEPVMTGGMDNPVDVTFTPEGERIFSSTYLVGDPRRDGLVHAIYGGVYGKQHSVIDGHPRTGELMPLLDPMHTAAPCGLERYEHPAFGPEFRDNLFLCQFNLRKVSRHVLRPAGSSFTSETTDFVTCDHVDFHPTDLIVDADGSLLVIDTGGWYKLCCPTSQLWKPDVLGGIYRVRREGAPVIDDPRGKRIAWADANAADHWTFLADARPAVRQRAARALVDRRNQSDARELVASLKQNSFAGVLRAGAGGAGQCDSKTAALARLWALAQLAGDERSIVSRGLDDADPSIRQAALHAVSLHRDAAAAQRVIELLGDNSSAVRRAAAEAAGRLGDAAAIPSLLAAAGAVGEDRILQHSLAFALIELADPQATRAGLASKAPGTIAAALVALDQMPSGSVDAVEVIPHLNSSDAALAATARWIVGQHPQWGGALAGWFHEQLAALPDAAAQEVMPNGAGSFPSMLIAFAGEPAIGELIARTAADVAAPIAARQIALRVMAEAKLNDPHASWSNSLASVVTEGHTDLLPLAFEAARTFSAAEASHPALDRALAAASQSAELSPELRLQALAAARLADGVDDAQFGLLLDGIALENEIPARSRAADAIARAPLKPHQFESLCAALAAAGPLEINRLVAAFTQPGGHQFAATVLRSLAGSVSLSAVRFDVLRTTFADADSNVLRAIDQLEAQLHVDAADQRKRIEQLLPELATGDVHRGHAVFYSAKAACTACHRLGLGGGGVGPDLSEIGQARTERDLLESILYPSLSFVRSFEPVVIVTAEGTTVAGTIRDESADGYLIATAADQEVRVPRADVEDIRPGTVSLMPDGLDKQLTTQEIADLVAFLKVATE